MRLSSFGMLFAFVFAGFATPGPAVAAGGQTPATPRKITIDDFLQIRDVDDPQISPEGSWVAYTVTTHKLKDDTNEDRIWMVPSSGGDAVPMTAEGVSSSHPRWSPDGKYLAFLSARDEGKTQVWLLNRNGGEAEQLTDTAQEVHSVEWSPSGDKMVLILQDPTPQELQAAKYKKEGKELPKTKQPPWIIDRLQFKEDEIGYLDHRRTHLYVFDVATRKMIQATSGDFDDSEPAWSPDGKYLAFASNRTPDADHNYNTDIWVVAADNTDQGKTLRQITTNPGADTAPSWSPDGKWITFVSQIDAQALDYATKHLAVAPSTGGEERALTRQLDRGVVAPKFSPDGRSILFILEDDGTQNLASMPLEGGAATRLVPGRNMQTAFSVDRQGDIAVLMSDPRRPFEVYGLSAGAASGDLRRLTKTNDAVTSELQLGEMDYVHFTSRDGTPVSAYMVKPPDYSAGKRYPALLRPHGGPVWAWYAEFQFDAQLFAANGYVVIMPNPRGSSGYGQKFSEAIFGDWGDKDFEDEMASVDYLLAQGFADPDRVGVGGWSYGGIMTNYCITKSNRFKAAITGASETLYIADYGHDEYQRDWELELGLPWEKRQIYEKLSPFNSVEKITAATLIMGGNIDWNVPVNNSEQLYQAMRRLGKTTELVVYPGEYHEFHVPSHIKDRYERYLAWYAHYLKGSAESPTPPAATGAEDSN